MTNYSQELKQYINRPSATSKAPSMSFLGMMALMKSWIFEKSSRSPRSKLPEVKPDLQKFLEPSDKMKFIWFGHSTLLLNLDGKILLIDPVFSEYAFSFDVLVKRYQPPALNLSELPPIDLIVISHNHHDHLDFDTISFFKDKKARFILPLGVGDNLRSWGFAKNRYVELNWGDSVTELGLKFTATPAQHFSGRNLLDRNKTLWLSWIIQSAEQNIYYSGDSGYGDHFREIGAEHGPFDLAFMENGQYNERWSHVHMLPEQTIQAFLDLRGKHFVPVHWGMFDLSLHPWNEPVERTFKMAQERDISYLSPKFGEIVDLANIKISDPWWLGLK